MKYWTSILAAAAIMALGASAAFGAGSQFPWEPTPISPSSGKTQVLGAKKVAPAVVSLRKQVSALKAKNRALAAKNRALAAEAKYQADRNVTLSNWIGELNTRIAELTKRLAGDTPEVTDPVNTDQECLDSLVCTPEQDCRLWGNNCPVAQTETPPADAMPADEQG